MAVNIKLKDNTYNAQTVIWDRDSFFISFENYWSRLVASIAQLIAEHTTDNWNKFNLVRTRVIKTLGINPEASHINNSSPILLLPVDCYSIILATTLSDILNEKSNEELSELCFNLTDLAIQESQQFINDSLNTESINKLKSIDKNNQILLTNDSEANNNIFLESANLQNSFNRTLTQINKLQLHSILQNDSYFITSNHFLQKVYSQKGLTNVLVIQQLDELLLETTRDNSPIVINTDGASKGNPGPAGIGIAFYKNGDLIKEVAENIGAATNNFAEYTALIRALEISLANGFNNIEIRSDSELAVKQINKLYKVKDPDIKILYDKAVELMNQFTSVRVNHVKREQNTKADKLANKGISIIAS